MGMKELIESQAFGVILGALLAFLSQLLFYIVRRVEEYRKEKKQNKQLDRRLLGTLMAIKGELWTKQCVLRAYGDLPSKDWPKTLLDDYTKNTALADLRLHYERLPGALIMCCEEAYSSCAFVERSGFLPGDAKSTQEKRAINNALDLISGTFKEINLHMKNMSINVPEGVLQKINQIAEIGKPGDVG